MNWGTLKDEIRNLGFEEDESITEYESIVISAANRSIEEMALNVLPILGTYTIVQDGTESDLKRYDFLELTAEDGTPKFYGFSEELPVLDNGERFNDFEVEGRHVLALDGALRVSLTVYYNRIPTMITPQTKNSFEIELDLMLHSMLPLLCSYYVWLDDDERKASYYFNRYEQMKDLVVSKNTRIVAEIRGGF